MAKYVSTRVERVITVINKLFRVQTNEHHHSCPGGAIVEEYSQATDSASIHVVREFQFTVTVGLLVLGTNKHSLRSNYTR